jgi:rRNA maturation endonuclease Nob1
MLDYNDYPEDVVKECLKYVNDITEEEVWEVARESEEIPNFSNIYLSLLFERVEEELEDTHEVIYYVNNLDSDIEVCKLEEDDENDN